jgi:hypothetical protein
VATLGLLLALVASVAQVPPADALVRARQLYNRHDYAGAIAAASEARRSAPLADAAGVVLARAYLEQYRGSLEASDLDAARAVLEQIDSAKLAGRDAVEYTIGLGESLYFDYQYGAAAELFGMALGRAESLDEDARETLFDWWAGALDWQAKSGPEDERKAVYARVLDGAERERARNERSAPAWYWVAAGARGTGDLDRAWGAAVAGWIRAPSFGARGGALRADLDRLVTQAILPERAVRLSPGADPRPTLTSLQTLWQALKEKWAAGGEAPAGGHAAGFLTS